MKRRHALGLLGVAPLTAPLGSPVKGDSLVQGLSKRWEKSKDYSVAVLDAMPNEAIEFSPSKDQLTFAQHLIHLSFINNMLFGFMMDDSGFKNMKTLFSAEYLLDRPDNINIFKPARLSERGESANRAMVSSYIKDTYDFVLSTLKQIDDKFLHKGLEKNKPSFLVGHTNLDLILRGENHTAHHRAQAIAYLRMKEINPPGYGEYNVL